MSILLETERLILRQPKTADIGHFVPLLNDFEVSKSLSRIAHPYTEDHACAFVTANAQSWIEQTDCSFAVLRKGDDAFIGMCGVHPAREWEFGYWVSRPHWGKGYATEAGTRVIAFAFGELNADILRAGWFYDNPASARVLEKLGFRPVGDKDYPCLARGRPVPSHRVALDRATYITRKMSP